MNKKFMMVIAMLVVLSLTAGMICKMANGTENKNDKIIATSFYPTYLITQNLVKNMDNVEVVNIAKNIKGCVHNYQLTPENMRTLENADTFVINGMDMESYLEEVAKKIKTIRIIDSSIGIVGIKESSEHEHNHEHNHEEDEHDHEEEVVHDEHDHEESYNSHIWLSTDNYKKQINNISEQLEKLDYLDKDLLNKNKEIYISKINDVEIIKNELKENIKSKNVKTITFHSSLDYLLEELNIESLLTIDVENEAGLSASQAKDAIEIIKDNNIKYIIADSSLNKKIPATLIRETGVKVIYLDNLLQGENNDLDTYINGMKINLEKLNKMGE